MGSGQALRCSDPQHCPMLTPELHCHQGRERTTISRGPCSPGGMKKGYSKKESSFKTKSTMHNDCRQITHLILSSKKEDPC